MILLKEASAGTVDKTYAERIIPVVDAFYRVYDTNGNGEIETFELQEIFTGSKIFFRRRSRGIIDHFFSELISGSSNMLINILETVKVFVVDNVLPIVVDAYCKGLSSLIKAEWPIPIETILSSALSNIPIPSQEDWENMKQRIVETVQNSASGSKSPMSFNISEFFTKFEASAVDGNLKKDACVEIAASCLKLETKNTDNEALLKTLDQKIKDLNSSLSNNPTLNALGWRLEIEADLVREIMLMASVSAQGGLEMVSFWRLRQVFDEFIFQLSFELEAANDLSVVSSTCWT
jgi:hypothetical protein